MYKIGEFSILGKTTVKTLRYYEQEKLLLPKLVDQNNYRHYIASQLLDLGKIISLRQTGISINDIKKILNGDNLESILYKQKEKIEKELNNYNYQLTKINYLLKEKKMKYEIITKELPSYTVYYQEGVIKDFSEITNFILNSAELCKELNPNIKCIKPDYCYVTYLDGEYKNKDIKIRYSQAVTKEGQGDDKIKFETLKPVEAVCIYHKGPYELLGNAYSYIMEYIEKNHLEIIDYPRERYIDGMWNKDDANDWLTEIQVPIIKK